MGRVVPRTLGRPIPEAKGPQQTSAAKKTGGAIAGTARNRENAFEPVYPHGGKGNGLRYLTLS